MPQIISSNNLQVGQWVYFSLNRTDSQQEQEQEQMEGLDEKQKGLYEANRFFLVISREDALFDACRCYLTDLNGETFDYCPRMHSMGFVSRVWGDSVNLISEEEVQGICGREAINRVYLAAEEHLGKMKDYFKKYPAQRLGQDGSKAKQLQKLNEIIESKAEGANDLASLLNFSMLVNPVSPVTDETSESVLTNNSL